MVARVAVVLVAVAGCSGKPRTEEVSPAVPAVGAAGDASAEAAMGSAGPVGDAARDGKGDLQVRVEWPDVPVAARASAGRTPCGTPRAPGVVPTTTWGIPDVLVIVDGASRSADDAHVVLADCLLSPRFAVGDALAATSQVGRPVQLVLRKRGVLAAGVPPGELTAGEPVPIQLPIAGHTAVAALEAGAIYSLETEGAAPDVAFVAAAPDGVAGLVTDTAGQATAHDLAAGGHAVTAWLPPRAGQPARIGHATASVAAGELSELTIVLAP